MGVPDTPILLGLISVAGVVITALGSILVAIITNRRESKNAANQAAEHAVDEAVKFQLAAKDERITLRDERIKMREEQLAECLGKSASVTGELQAAIDELKTVNTKNTQLQAEVDRLLAIVKTCQCKESPNEP